MQQISTLGYRYLGVLTSVLTALATVVWLFVAARVGPPWWVVAFPLLVIVGSGFALSKPRTRYGHVGFGLVLGAAVGLLISFLLLVAVVNSLGES